ncbi:hypothetical protein ALQ65_102368 [Pseudomonas syringae pv. coriandricola]|uniref:Uncharacterized protein n=1 Tax=Pseudomonas syringae pv. coriandricola TaxID=264453 RepID=A0A0N8QXR7_9PSED|nr:hypothetical protein ALO76_102526 [Pseudomonas syringae pv. coriandricola]RMN10325.1 hypothetical protein ALQ65_102368 [Pseudomonas syringae pv. coriandricola]
MVPPPQSRLRKEVRPSFQPLPAHQSVPPGTFILHRSIRYANVPKRTNETPSRDDSQQAFDARYQGSRPLALARLTISLPARPDPYLYAFGL